MKTLLSKPAALWRQTIAAGRDDVWDALEWLAMPVFILYPQLVVLKCYRYGS